MQFTAVYTAVLAGFPRFPPFWTPELLLRAALMSRLSKKEPGHTSSRIRRVLFGLCLVISLAFAQAIHFHIDFEQGSSGQCSLCVASHTPTALTMAQLGPLHVLVSFERVQHGAVLFVQHSEIFDLYIRPPPVV
jgi:hypothetical protein